MLAMALLPMVCQAFATASFGVLINQISRQILQRLTGKMTVSCDNHTLGPDHLEQSGCTLISETLIITTSQPLLHLPQNHLSHLSDTIIESPNHGFPTNWSQAQSHSFLLENTSSTTYIETYLQQLVSQVSPLYGHDLNLVRHHIHEALEETLKQYPIDVECLAESFPVSNQNTVDQSPLLIPKSHQQPSSQLIVPNSKRSYSQFASKRLDKPM